MKSSSMIVGSSALFQDSFKPSPVGRCVVDGTVGLMNALAYRTLFEDELRLCTSKTTI